MDYSSEEESDISESEIEEYSEKPYKQLKDGNYKVKNNNGTLRCPYCAGKKKQEFKYKDLLQHASGVGKGSANRSAIQKANHLALAKYLETDLVNEAEQIPHDDACSSNSIESSARPIGREAAKKKGKKKSAIEVVDKEWDDYRIMREKEVEHLARIVSNQQEKNKLKKMSLYLKLSSDENLDDRKKAMLDSLTQELFPN